MTAAASGLEQAETFRPSPAIASLAQSRLASRVGAIMPSGLREFALASSQGHQLGCFLAGTLLRTPQVGTLIAVEQLQQDDIIQSASGNQLRVAEITLLEEVHECVEIVAGGCTLVVTGSHRVMVARGQQLQHKRAAALHNGDRVLCNDGNQPITRPPTPQAGLTATVRAVSQLVSAYQIVLQPDEPVDTIVVQQGTALRAPVALLTLGHRIPPPVRRGGMTRRRTSTSGRGGE